MKQNNQNIYFNAELIQKVILNCNEMYATNRKEIIRQKLALNNEGKCINVGLVKKNSIKVEQITGGVLDEGKCTFTVSFKCKILNPKEGDLLITKIVAINKSGMEGILVDDDVQNMDDTPIIIHINREINIDKEEYNAINEDDIIAVEVIATAFELNDLKVFSTCLLRPDIDLANERTFGDSEDEEEES
jgi:hypothetical protein